MALKSPVMPSQFQAEQEALARRRKFAEAIMAQSLQPQTVPQYGAMASKMSPLQPLAQMLQAHLANKGARRVDQDAAALQNRIGIARQGELDQLNQPDPQQMRVALQRALASQFPEVRASAETRLKQMDDTLYKGVDALKDSADPQSIVQALRSRSLDGMAFRTPADPKMQYFGDNPVAITENLKGEKKVTPLKVGTSITNTLSGKTDLELDKSAIMQLEKGKEGLAGAKNTVAATVRAVELLNKGADAGGGASVRQAIRQFGAAMGVNIPETGLTAELRAQLGNNLLANIRALAPVTANDVVVMERLLGSIDTDPNALRELSAMMLAKTMMTVDLHNALVEQTADVSSGSKNKYSVYKTDLGAFDTKDPALLGRAYQLMKNAGHDMSKYRFDGRPVNEIDFNIDFYAQPQKQSPTTPPPGRIKLENQ